MTDPSPETAAKSLLTSLAESSLRTDDALGRVLQVIRSHLGMDVAYISEGVAGRRIVRYIDAAAGKALIQVGDPDPVDDGDCRHGVAEGPPERLSDPAAGPAAMAPPATPSLAVGAHRSVPIRLQDGRIFGTFCCFNFAPTCSLTEGALQMMRAFAELTGHLIDRGLEASRGRQEQMARITTVIERGQFSILYQPIYRLADQRVIGLECLTQFTAAPSRSPDIWFSEAAEVGLDSELEMAVVRKALSELSKLPTHILIGFNVSPATLLKPEFVTAFADISVERIVLEVTEHAPFSAYTELLRTVEPLRRRGLRLAVDDVGAGYAGLQHILNLHPDLIKIDMSLTRHIDRDPARRALTSALIGFARDMGCQIIAEGIETEAELAALRALGVRKAQGYLLARPMPLADASRLLAER